MRKILKLLLLLTFSAGVFVNQTFAKTPVLVELFTSQGCPTCPAADKILTDLETTQPIDSAEIITLAWHVDYWDGFGWKDEFSSPVFSQRQVAYSRALNFSGTYTPQMFVDGTTHFIGTKLDKATKGITNAAKNAKPELNLSLAGNKLKITIPTLPKHERATVFLAFTQDNISRKIGRGNNAGKTLLHTSVARDLRSVGSVEAQVSKFEAETVLQFQPDWDKENLNLIVFVQENGSRKILAVSRVNL